MLDNNIWIFPYVNMKRGATNIKTWKVRNSGIEKSADFQWHRKQSIDWWHSHSWHISQWTTWPWINSRVAIQTVWVMHSWQPMPGVWHLTYVLIVVMAHRGCYCVSGFSGRNLFLFCTRLGHLKVLNNVYHAKIQTQTQEEDTLVEKILLCEKFHLRKMCLDKKKVQLDIECI